MALTTLRSFIETTLNEQQKSAALHSNGCILIIAGAGSGKTRVITTRIAHLITHESTTSDAIIALTFTNKAAKEMQERVQHFLGSHRTELPFIGTFHAYCLKLLKMHPGILNIHAFSIIDADDQEKILQNIIKRSHFNKQITTKQLLYQISLLKNYTFCAEQQKAYFIQNPLLQELFNAYEQEKKLSKCLDFDDLLHYGLKLFNNADFKTQFQQRVRHVLVDEYQDTNVVQHALLKAMTTENMQFNIDSLCVVGDEDQSIYSWRGATVANMINFKQDFPCSDIIKLEQNYRSAQSILDIANHVIQHNKQRNPKQLWSNKAGTDRIINILCSSEYQEGDVIAQLCKNIQSTQNLNSCAVLYRAHFQSRAIEEALIKQAIPYKIFGGIQFYERKEIKDLLAYMRLIINPFDRPSLLRIINCPTRGLGEAFETLLYEYWDHEPFLTFKQVIEKLLQTEAVKGKKIDALQQFLHIFNNLDVKLSPSQALQEILKQSKYVAYIKNTYDDEDVQTRIDNINEFIRAIEHFLQIEPQGTLDRFLETVALMQEQAHSKAHEANALLLMTYHAAKGLEFDTVILAGLEEGLLPSSRSLHDDNAIEEERRLFYVGITRAKERLMLSKSRYRYTYGKMNAQQASRFLKEIPEHLITMHDTSNLQPYAIKQLLDQWIHGQVKQKQPVITFASHATCTKPQTTLSKQSDWNIKQLVHHATFGSGIITHIEHSQERILLTVRFKSGTKKVVSSFISRA